MVSNFTSNNYAYDSNYINTLSLNSLVNINLDLKGVSNISTDLTNISTVISEIISKMNCVLFDDIFIYEKIKSSDKMLTLYIYKNLYNPITFKFNNYIKSEDDIIANSYKTYIKPDSTTVVEFDSILTNNILYKDVIYYRNITYYITLAFRYFIEQDFTIKIFISFS